MTDAARINVLDPEFYVDPWESYRWLRTHAPVFWDPVQKLWVLSRFEDVMAIEKNDKLYSSFYGSRPHIDLTGDESMINLDEPDHHAQRVLVAPRFSPRAMRLHTQRVRDVVTEILDAVTPLGACEAIEAIASRLPAIVIAELLGYAHEQWEDVRRWSEQIMLLSGQTSPQGPPHALPPELISVVTEFYLATTAVIEQRRAEPRDDLISLWAHGHGWADKRVIDEVLLVLDGGAETTRTVIGTMIRDLTRYPDQRARLLADPGLLASTATEEFIRWVTPVLNMRRTATADHELHGQRIRTGDEILLLYPSANRDERAFTDPDALDVTRSSGRHLAFGFGTHICLGANLARLEIRVMFEEMLRRMPDWELADPDEPQVMPATFTRAYDQVRIRFTPSPPSG